jgi:hypothetical protein
MVVIVSSRPVKSGSFILGILAHFDLYVIVASANIGSFGPEDWHSLTLPNARIGGNFQTWTHDELAQPELEHEPSQQSSGPQ